MTGNPGDVLRGLPRPEQGTRQHGVELDRSEVPGHFSGLDLPERVERDVGHPDQPVVCVGGGLAVSHQDQGGLTLRRMPDQVVGPNRLVLISDSREL
jgi:hypothetical protein